MRGVPQRRGCATSQRWSCAQGASRAQHVTGDGGRARRVELCCAAPWLASLVWALPNVRAQSRRLGCLAHIPALYLEPMATKISRNAKFTRSHLVSALEKVSGACPDVECGPTFDTTGARRGPPLRVLTALSAPLLHRDDLLACDRWRYRRARRWWCACGRRRWRLRTSASLPRAPRSWSASRRRAPTPLRCASPAASPRCGSVFGSSASQCTPLARLLGVKYCL